MAVLGGTACSAEESVGAASHPLFFDTPSGVIGTEGDALVSELDNPLITGRVNLDGITFHTVGSLTWPYDSKLLYQPRTRVLVASHSVFTPGMRPKADPDPDPAAGPDLTRLWLEFEGEDGPFTSPAVALPPRLAADPSEHVELLLGARGGPEPWPTDLAEPLVITLHPQVIVIPVHVHAFVAGSQLPPFGTGGVQPLDTDIVRNWLDPSPVVERQAALHTDGGIKDAYTRMDQFQTMAMEVDPIWAQCGIQFRLATFDTIETTEIELAFSLAQSGECEAAGFNVCNLAPFRFKPFVEAAQEIPGLHVFLGGAIASNCTSGATDVYGLTCNDICGFGMGFHPPHFTLIALRDTFGLAPEVRTILAHEIGHLLTLGHEDHPCTSGGFDSENLMFSSAAGGRELTTEQCQIARLAALTYLDRWELPVGPEWDTVYAP